MYSQICLSLSLETRSQLQYSFFSEIMLIIFTLIFGSGHSIMQFTSTSGSKMQFTSTSGFNILSDVVHLVMEVKFRWSFSILTIFHLIEVDFRYMFLFYGSRLWTFDGHFQFCFLSPEVVLS